MPDRHYGTIHLEDAIDQVTPDLIGQQSRGPMEPYGISGFKRSAGILDEEFLPALRGRKAIKVFREMYLNSPVVGALMFAIEFLLRQAEWNVVAASQEDEDREAAEFVEQCMDDMSKTWDATIAEILSFLVYGWNLSEIVYKKRVGPWEKDPKNRSQYTDGKIGWRKIETRAQETMQRWIFDEDGGVQAMVQMAPPYYKTAVIPIDRCLLFRYRENKGSPEGISMLRNAYRPWFFLKRLEEFEAIGVERDLAGMPVAKIPAEMMSAQAGTQNYKTFQAFKQMVRGIRRDEHEGIVMPMAYDRETKQPLYEFELLSAGGSRQLNTQAIIERYEQRILMSVLADFIMLGQQGSGSYAMHVDKTGIFRAALNATAKNIADVFNRHAIPRLFAINGWKPNELPKIVPSNVDAPNLGELASFMSSLAGMGMEWFPDADLEKFIRKSAGLPDIPDDKLEMRREMSEQSDMMSYAQMQMEMLGVRQKAEMASQGMTPEQAEQAAQAPTPEMQAQQEVAQYKGHAIAQQDPDVAQAQAEEQESGMQQQAQKMEIDAAKQEQQLQFKADEHNQKMQQARETKEASSEGKGLRKEAGPKTQSSKPMKGESLTEYIKRMRGEGR